MPVVKFLLRLDLEEKISFLDRHQLAPGVVSDWRWHDIQGGWKESNYAGGDTLLARFYDPEKNVHCNLGMNSIV